MTIERGVSMIDVVDRVLDRGIVIDYWAKFYLLGVDILTTVDARVVVASLDTYLQYSEPISKAGSIARHLPRVDLDALRKH
jgi:hypothetical protein